MSKYLRSISQRDLSIWGENVVNIFEWETESVDFSLSIVSSQVKRLGDSCVGNDVGIWGDESRTPCLFTHSDSNVNWSVGLVTSSVEYYLRALNSVLVVAALSCNFVITDEII